MKVKNLITVILCVLVVFSFCSCGVIRRSESFDVSGLFADNMVLQRDKTVPVFGTGSDGTVITVSFGGQTKTATVSGGAWRVDLDSLSASKEGRVLSVSASDGTHTDFENVLVGDVWLCSGQSNMYWKIQYCDEREQTRLYKEINNSLIRSCYIEPIHSSTPKTEIDRQHWVESNEQTMALFSAYATSFAQTLQPALDIPIGIITSAEGSTSIERWVSGGENYNAMIKPLQPFAITGVLWYQGENNVLKDGNYSVNYPASFRQLVSEWRTGFENDNMPVMQTQIAGFGMPDSPEWADWAKFMILQPTYTSYDENTYTVVNYDLGDMRIIHPNTKSALGPRAANLALQKFYKIEGYYGSAPYVEKYEITADGILFTFGDVNEPLTTSTSKARGFSVCGADGVFKTLTGQVVGTNQVLVDTSEVTFEITEIRFNVSNYLSKTVMSGKIPVMNFWIKL